MIWGQNLSEITLATYCKHCADRTCCCYAGLHYVYSTFSRIIIPRRRLLIIPCGCVRRRWKFGGSNCWTKSRQRLSNETHSPASVRLSVHAVLTSSRRIFHRKEFETISHTEDTVTDDVYRGKGDIVIFNKVGGTLMTGNFNGVNNYPADFFSERLFNVMPSLSLLLRSILQLLSVCALISDILIGSVSLDRPCSQNKL